MHYSLVDLTLFSSQIYKGGGMSRLKWLAIALLLMPGACRPEHKQEPDKVRLKFQEELTKKDPRWRVIDWISIPTDTVNEETLGRFTSSCTFADATGETEAQVSYLGTVTFVHFPNSIRPVARLTYSKGDFEKFEWKRGKGTEEQERTFRRIAEELVYCVEATRQKN
jgi:hypothetical protein